MRWAQERGMPVHAVPGGKTRTVFAYRHELEIWSRQTGEDEEIEEASPPPLVDGATPSTSFDRRKLIGGSLLAGAIVASGGAGWAFHKRRRLPAAAEDFMTSGLDAFRQMAPDQVAQAIADFQSAALLAPNHPEPWASMGLAYQTYATAFASGAEVPLFVSRAREAALRALEIDPENEDAAAIAPGLIPQFRNWRVAGKAIESALARFPRAFSINRLAAQFYAQTGQLNLVQQCSLRALETDSRWPQLMTNMIMSSWALGQIEKADRYLARAVEQWPRYYNVWFVRERLLTYTGRALQALEVIQDTANRPLGIPSWNFDQCRLEAQALLTRAPADIDAAAKGYEIDAPRGIGFANNAVQFFSEFGLIEEAFSLLRALYFNNGVRIGDTRYSVEQGQFASRRSRDTWILWLPMCARLRSDPRFPEILNALGLADYWEKTNSPPAAGLIKV